MKSTVGEVSPAKVQERCRLFLPVGLVGTVNVFADSDQKSDEFEQKQFKRQPASYYQY
jgi:hypothetical protein